MLKTKLRELRTKKGVSQKTVAEYLGISRASYTRYESGERHPNSETMVRLAEYFEVPVGYFLAPNEDNELVYALMQKYNKLIDAGVVQSDGSIDAAKLTHYSVVFATSESELIAIINAGIAIQRTKNENASPDSSPYSDLPPKALSELDTYADFLRQKYKANAPSK